MWSLSLWPLESSSFLIFKIRWLDRRLPKCFKALKSHKQVSATASEGVLAELQDPFIWHLCLAIWVEWGIWVVLVQFFQIILPAMGVDHTNYSSVQLKGGVPQRLCSVTRLPPIKSTLAEVQGGTPHLSVSTILCSLVLNHVHTSLIASHPVNNCCAKIQSSKGIFRANCEVK